MVPPMPDPPRNVISDDPHGALAGAAAVLARAGYEVTRVDAGARSDPDTRAGPAPDAATSRRLVLLAVRERTHAELLQGCAARLLEAISIGEPLPDLLQMIALGVEEIVPDAQVSILLLDPDGVHLR